MSGNDGREVTPVPIPNTEVKLSSADGSWDLVPVRVGRCQAILFRSSSAVELSAVNRSVVGSIPTCGAIGELSELAEGARLEIVYTSQAYQGFESLALRHIQKADKPLICKDLSVFLCLFSGRYDFLRVFAESCASFRGLLRAVFYIQINGNNVSG